MKLRTIAQFTTTVLLGICTSATANSYIEHNEQFDHVILISVDGLRSDALLVEPDELPNFTRLFRQGASTLNARTDPAWSNTLPNHLDMLTGRFVEGSGGHGWTLNSYDPDQLNIHTAHGGYVSSIFDVAAEHEVRTRAFVSKRKFLMVEKSWGRDVEKSSPSADKRRDTIDTFYFADRGALEISPAKAVTDALLAALQEDHHRSLNFLHYREPDAAGHGSGWNLSPDSPYLESIEAVDAQLGRIFDAIERSETLSGDTAIVLTSDHGGGAPHRNHGRADMWVNYVIPFVVWSGEDNPAADLYEINANTRRNPGLTRPAAKDKVQPIRNGDAGNLALSLLGLPAISGSTINVDQDLKVTVGSENSVGSTGGQ